MQMCPFQIERKREIDKWLISKSTFQSIHHSQHPPHPQSKAELEDSVLLLFRLHSVPRRAARSAPSPVQWLVGRPLVNPSRGGAGGVLKKFSRKQETTRDQILLRSKHEALNDTAARAQKWDNAEKEQTYWDAEAQRLVLFSLWGARVWTRRSGWSDRQCCRTARGTMGKLRGATGRPSHPSGNSGTRGLLRRGSKNYWTQN